MRAGGRRSRHDAVIERRNDGAGFGHRVSFGKSGDERRRPLFL
jgi:hypothetical protein